MADTVIPFPRQFADPVKIHRLERMLFINGEILRTPINLAGAGVNDPDGRAALAAHLQQGQLTGSVRFQVIARILHAAQVADLCGQVEEEILLRKDIPHLCLVTYISNDGVDVLFDTVKVIGVSAIIWGQIIDDIISIGVKLKQPTAPGYCR